MTRRMLFSIILSLLALALPGCGLLEDPPPTVTPIIVTATDPVPIVPIVATETPGPTAVVAVTDVSLLPTQGPRTETPTPHAPATNTPTFTPTATDTPVTPGAAAFAPVGSVPGTAQAAAEGGVGVPTGCAGMPQGAFAAAYQGDSTIQAALGCALAGGTGAVGSAYQPFQNGMMIWLASLGTQPQPVIYVLYNNGTYQRFNDTFVEGVDPASSGAAPPGGLLEPVRGFGKVWRSNPGVRDGLGWATAGESADSAQVQMFERGEMLSSSAAGQVYILVTGAPGTWTARR